MPGKLPVVSIFRGPVDVIVACGSAINWIRYCEKRDNLWNWIAEDSYDIRDTP